MTTLDAVLLAVPLLFAVAFGASALYEAWVDSRLRAAGTTTEGHIAELRTDSRAGLTYAFVEYNYQSGGETYTSRQAISAAHCARLKEGDQIAVSYLPSNPAISRMAGGDQDDTNRRSMTVRALMLLVVWVVLMVVVKR